MKNLVGRISFKQLEIIGVFWGVVAGTLLHFTYNWSHQSKIVALFSAATESVWEHNKLLFFPVLIFAFLEWFWIKNKRQFLFAKLAEIVIGMLFIITFFYTYTGAFGIENLWIDIASFVAAVILGKSLSFAILTSDYEPKLHTAILATSLVVLTLCFFAATFEPPKIPLFKDSETGNYGIGLFDDEIIIDLN